MFGKLLFLFLAVPLVEIALFIEIGARIGTLTTLLIIFCTAILGAMLARHEGLKTWWRIQERLRSGQLPDEELLDGLLILLAGALLLTPGFLTDAVGLLLLYQGSRQPLKRWLQARLRRRLQVQYWEWYP
ncbi:MAG: hypothetical protein KatS3mg131_2348 [Candidatus Tectimicrobiota bacterium]|nr:MAG: hypothetical protein KatS3mg131_2348 [Candidatus Tectomicrobia bacterium]